MNGRVVKDDIDFCSTIKKGRLQKEKGCAIISLLAHVYAGPICNLFLQT